MPARQPTSATPARKQLAKSRRHIHSIESTELLLTGAKDPFEKQRLFQTLVLH